MAKKRRQDKFIGRVWWYDPSASNDYQYEQTHTGLERVGYFRTPGLIDMTDKFTCIVIHDEEIIADEKQKVRSNTDIPWVNVIKIEEHFGKDKWREVKF